MKRLDFRLPDFTRIAWVSDTARELWQPRFDRITHAWAELEWRSVAAGMRPCHLTRLAPEDLVDRATVWAKRGLSALPLALEGRSGKSYSNVPQPARPGQPSVLCLAVGPLGAIVELSAAWQASDNEAIGRLLGFPACCRRFFERTWVEEGCIDTLWPMTEATAGHTTGDEGRRRQGRTTLTNILWRFVGVRAVPHLPCRFDCAASLELAERLLALGEAEGFGQEMAWIRELLACPVEWTALHGIAEIKTPLLKISTTTDATPVKYTVRLTGDAYPEAGASAPSFPYRRSAGLVRLTRSPSFRRGFKNPMPTLEVAPSWLNTDNGFSTRHVMDQLHEPLVAVARRRLSGRSGRVLDLGCGNGALLAKICAERDELEPWGVDLEPARIAHARELHPDHAESFAAGDLFTWMLEADGGGRRYALALLMVGRLLEAPHDRARALLSTLAACCDDLLLYRYPEAYDQREVGLRETAARFDLVLDPVVEHCGLVAAAAPAVASLVP